MFIVKEVKSLEELERAVKLGVMEAPNHLVSICYNGVYIHNISQCEREEVRYLLGNEDYDILSLYTFKSYNWENVTVFYDDYTED